MSVVINRLSGSRDRMIEKRPAPTPGKVLVTFRIPESVWADRITLIGDFNNWDENAHPLVQTRSDPDWHITLELDAGRRYQFRYLRDGQEWNTDDDADDYVEDEAGHINFVVDTNILPPESTPKALVSS